MENASVMNHPTKIAEMVKLLRELILIECDMYHTLSDYGMGKLLDIQRRAREVLRREKIQ